MAYVAFAQEMGSAAGATRIASIAATRSVSAPAPVPASVTAFVPAAKAPAAQFSALEWSVVALARKDRVSSLRTPGRLSVALGTLFGEGHNPRLADPQLEALRRMAVLSWHRGYSVAPAEVRAFVAAGYSLDQYELLLDSIHAGLADERAGRGAERLRKNG